MDGQGARRRAANIRVLDDDAAEDSLRYVLAHGVKEGLVERSEDLAGRELRERAARARAAGGAVGDEEGAQAGGGDGLIDLTPLLRRVLF